MDMEGSKLWWDDREQGRQGSGSSSVNVNGSAGMAYPNALDEYEQGKDNLLDHLVSAQQRAEEPAPVPITAYPSGETALDSMLAACREAEDSYCSRKQWSPQVLDRFNNAFAAVIQVLPSINLHTLAQGLMSVH